MTEIKNKRERDYKTELLRIIGCFIVIGTHIKLVQYFNNGVPDKSIMFISGLFTEGVTIFFMILGFFYFNNTSFKKMLKRLFFRVLIPVFAYVLFAALFADWLNGEKSIFESALQSNIAFTDIVKGLFSWHLTGVEVSGHLWYIFTYVQCILFFPLLRSLKGEKNKKARLYVIAIGILAIILTDINKMIKPSFIIAPFTLVPAALVIMLLGNEFYSCRESLSQKKFLIIALIAYVLSKVLIYKLTYRFMEEGATSFIFSWETLLAIISAVAIVLSAYI